MPPGQPNRPRRMRNKILLAVIVAVVVIAGGTVGGIYAFRNTAAASGASTPTAAASHLFHSLGKQDIVGVVDELAPAEADLFTRNVDTAFAELKRLDIVREDVDPQGNGKPAFTVSGIRFDKQGVEHINDHLAITKLVAGTITFKPPQGQSQLTKKFQDLLDASMDSMGTPEKQTIDVGEHAPVRIATVQVDGSWYPSLFYTIADNVLNEAGHPWPEKAISAHGADSPNGALRQLVNAALAKDIKGVIELLPPDTMGVLHDVGPVIVDAAGEPSESGVKLVDLQTTRKDIDDGALLQLKSIVLEKNGQRVSVRRDGDCYIMQAPQGQQKLCASSIADRLEVESPGMPDAAKSVIRRMASAYFDAGVVATEVDGQWYVSPIRSVEQLGLALLKQLEPSDIDAIADLGH